MSDPALPAVLRAIEARGPIPFAAFMAIAVGDAETGYYTRADNRPTRTGDFLTAPELHPIFGAAIARQLHEVWERLERPAALTLVEFGAGSGTLARDILAGLRADGSGLAAALRHAPIELNPHRMAELEAGAVAVGLPVDEARPGLTGVVLANEFLDALPVHVVEMRDGALREVHVAAGADGRLHEVLLPPSTPALARHLDGLAAEGVRLAEGQRTEICLEVDDWAARAGEILDRGVVLVIDYGAPAAELHGPRHRAGTLMTYRAHVADGAREAPFRDVGERDITAHVDTTMLSRALIRAGFEIEGMTTQALFLAGCDLDGLLERERAGVVSMEAWLVTRSAIMRLLDPRHLGGFRVLIGRRGLADGPSLRGLGFRPPR